MEKRKSRFVRDRENEGWKKRNRWRVDTITPCFTPRQREGKKADRVGKCFACVWRNKKENGEEPWRLEVEGFEGRGQRKIRLMQASKLNVTSDDNATKPANNSPLGIVIYLVGVERCCVV